jgi:hypothetical protein
MMISKRATGIYGSVVAAAAVVAAALSGCGSSGGDSATQQTTKPGAGPRDLLAHDRPSELQLDGGQPLFPAHARFGDAR